MLDFLRRPEQTEEKKEIAAEKRQFTQAQQAELVGSAMQDQAYQERADEKADLTRWQQDLNEDVELFIRGLKRESYDVSKQCWVRQKVFVRTDANGEPVFRDMKPMMNSIGLTSVKNSIMLNVSRNLIMSNYSEDQIFRKLRTNVTQFISFIGLNFSRFDVDKRDLSVIVQMYKDIIEPTHWRCLNDGERRYLNTVNKRVEAYTEHAAPPEKKGILGSMGM